jgi:Protein of unknown function (DUF1360)
MHPAVVIFVYALAAMRVTGLITADAVTAPLRTRLTEWLIPEDAPRMVPWRRELAFLITCAWCVSIYVGVVAAVVWYTVGNTPLLLVIAVALAFSQLTGMFSDVGRG